MSAIGDYVHWSYSGYVEKRGAQKNPYFSGYKSALTNRENHFNQWVQKQENKAIKDLEKETQKSLNLLKGFKENKGNRSQVEDNQMAMALLNDLWNELDTKYLKVDKVAAAALGLIDAGGFGSGATNIGKNTFTQQATTGNINNQIENLLNTTLLEINNSINQLSTKQQVNMSTIQKSVEKTQKNITNFMSNLQQKGRIMGSNGQKETAQQIEKIFKDIKNVIQNNEGLNEAINIEGLLNSLVLGLSAGMTANQYKGDISEALISVMGKRMAGVALKSANSTIKSAAVTGQQRSARGLNTNYFVSDVDWNTALKDETYIRPYGEFIVSAKAVQDKMDVQISLEDNSTMNISVKNYSSKILQKGITNESASFLTLIQNENKNNFINHYLNLNSVTGKGRSSLAASATEVNNFLRKIIVAKLIAGYNTTTGLGNQTMTEVNVFTVFNSDNYTVKFYNIKDVLDGVFKNGRYQKLYIPEALYKDNYRTPDYKVRISNLLRQLDIRVAYTLKEEEYAKK